MIVSIPLMNDYNDYRFLVSNFVLIELKQKAKKNHVDDMMVTAAFYSRAS